MKNSILLIVVIAMALFAACEKNEMMNDSLNINVTSYESKLNQDYTQALQYHSALLTTKNLYNKIMFSTNDSLFSEHFYLFCIDMMKNSGMMSSANGMMGNKSGMMGNSGMMNGGTMGNMQDINKMLAYMDSLRLSPKNSLTPGYYINDSLLHNQMTMCKMMTSQTNGVENVFNNMQILRKNHKMMN